MLERLEIERRYWAAKQIDFGIITQKEIPTKMVKNIEWIHSSLYTYEERGLTENSLENYCNILIDKFRDSKYSIRKITSDFDKENDVSDGTGLYIFKYLLASKHIYIDMNESIDIAKSRPKIIIDWGARYASNQ